MRRDGERGREKNRATVNKRKNNANVYLLS